MVELKEAIHLFTVWPLQPPLKVGAREPLFSEGAIKRDFQRNHDRQKREGGAAVVRLFQRRKIAPLAHPGGERSLYGLARAPRRVLTGRAEHRQLRQRGTCQEKG